MNDPMFSSIKESVRDSINRVMNGIYTVLGNQFSIQDLYFYTEACRTRPLFIQECNFLTAETNGFCMVLLDTDIIGIREGMNPFLRITTEAHEIGHILAGHADERRKDITLAQFLECPDFSDAYFRGFEDNFDPEAEAVANEIEALVLEAIDVESLTSRAKNIRVYFGGE